MTVEKIFGVDFSGSARAGRKIWVSSGTASNRIITIESCQRAAELPASGSAREVALEALRQFIREQRNCVVGLDFPFSLPAPLLDTTQWEEFILAFARRFPASEQFRRWCFESTGMRELRRQTDALSRTPFSPYNLRLFRQTYFGISAILAPLIQEQSECVLPFQPPAETKPWLLEICPASTVKRVGLAVQYKGRKAPHTARRDLLGCLEARGDLVVTPAVRSLATADTEGDALDSIIAAYATFHAVLSGNLQDPADAHFPREGRVYF